MIPSAILLFGVALTGADAGVAVPADALAPLPTAAVRPAPQEAKPIRAFVPPPEPPELLVGREAWLEQKYLMDPVIEADHGRPTVIFETNDPALHR